MLHTHRVILVYTYTYKVKSHTHITKVEYTRREKHCVLNEKNLSVANRQGI